jgi:hypothetical protein
MHTLFSSENIKEKDDFEDIDIYGRMILKCTSDKWGLDVWN